MNLQNAKQQAVVSPHLCVCWKPCIETGSPASSFPDFWFMEGNLPKKVLEPLVVTDLRTTICAK